MPTILVVEDDIDLKDTVVAHLESEDYNVLSCTSGAEALKLLGKENVDVLLLDIMMEGLKGDEVCQRIRTDIYKLPVYIIVQSVLKDSNDIARLLDMGADDYIVKPLNPVELLARVRVGVRLADQRDKAFHDGLTGAFNRNFLDEYIARNADEALSLCLVDVDFFKKVNDMSGHEVGDVILKEVCTVFQKTLRKEDLLVRYGGEEFLVLFPGAEVYDARMLAEKIRKSVQLHKFSEGKKITVSIGVSGKASSVRELISQADEALYRAKNSGRNQVILYDDK